MLIEKLIKKEGFTEIETQLSEIILNYGNDLGWLSIRELADLAFTSTTTIQRFCRKLGCDSYKDMKLRYLNEYSKGNNEFGAVDVNRPFHFGAQPALIANNLGKVYSRAIETTIEQLDYNAVNTCADLIRSADLILMFGTGDSGITARSFMNRIMKIGKYCVMASEYGEDNTVAMAANKKCLGIFVTYRGGLNLQIQAARIMKQNSIPFIVLSSDTRTYLTENADAWIKVPSLETQSDNIGTFFSQECFGFCLNLIYSVVYTRSYLENQKRKRDVDQLTSVEHH